MGGICHEDVAQLRQEHMVVFRVPDIESTADLYKSKEFYDQLRIYWASISWLHNLKKLHKVIYSVEHNTYRVIQEESA